MSLLQKVIGIMVFIIVLYFLYKLFSKSGTSLVSTQQDATIMTTIPASSLSTSDTQNYTYSVWIYIDNWNYRYGETKKILSRIDGELHPSPLIELGAFSNDIITRVNCYPDSSADQNEPIDQIHHTVIRNVPLQAWVNYLVSLNNRTLDVYLDGKLVKTSVLPGVAKIATSVPVLITPEGGFSGFIANVKYWPNATNPSQAWNIYRGGYGGSMFGNLFNKYRLKIAFLNDNQETGSIEI